LISELTRISSLIASTLPAATISVELIERAFGSDAATARPRLCNKFAVDNANSAPAASKT